MEVTINGKIIHVNLDSTPATLIAYDPIKKEASFLINNRVIKVTNITGTLSSQLNFFMGSHKITCCQHTAQPAPQLPSHNFQQQQLPHRELTVPTLTSPLAGRVITILVSAGQHVTAGQPLVIIESMKMENELCAPNNAFIKTLSIAPGNLVQTNQVLIIFELKGELNAITKDRHGQATI